MDTAVGYKMKQADIFELIKKNQINSIKRNDLNTKTVNLRNNDKETPLMVACTTGCVKTVKLLVEAGAKINAFNKFGDTALHIACGAKRNEDIIRYLLVKGARINKRNFLGRTPLIVASASGFSENVAQLLKYFPLVNIKTPEEETALTFAIVWDYKKIVQLLAEAGADINLKDSHGWTPFRYALSGGNSKMIDLLRKFGAFEAGNPIGKIDRKLSRVQKW
jgi:ankyrin repeat protein